MRKLTVQLYWETGRSKLVRICPTSRAVIKTGYTKLFRICFILGGGGKILEKFSSIKWNWFGIWANFLLEVSQLSSFQYGFSVMGCDLLINSWKGIAAFWLVVGKAGAVAAAVGTCAKKFAIMVFIWANICWDLMWSASSSFDFFFPKADLIAKIMRLRNSMEI